MNSFKTHNKKRITMNKILLGLTMMIVSFFGQAKQDVYTSFASSTAIKGYDPVAYFTQDKAVKGSDDFSFEYKEVTWLFSSQEHLEMFKATPEKYEPQYGGYCAFAMANGSKVKVNPKSFTVLEGKLYLNYSEKIKVKWLASTAEYIEDADQVWADFK